jgi:peptidoglycan/xylan/chitin deacetylase (PgdA/CDA1 family)
VKRIALTLDDGPSRWTAPILDALAVHNAHATFFVLGVNCGYDHVIRRTINEGHELGVHGWDHRLVEELGATEIQQQLADTVEQIMLNGHTIIRWWRPPWHRVTRQAAQAAETLGLSYCRSTVETYDVNRSARMIADTVYDEVADGSIVGLHDGVASNGNQETPHRNNTVRAVEEILQTMSGDYRFVTVSELLG